MGKANLTYYVAEELLTGKVAGRMVHMAAKSGCGAVGPEDAPGAAPATPAAPIPVGKYTIQSPGPWHAGQSALLLPVKRADGTLPDAAPPSIYRIHAQRLLGSDRSIVPVHAAEFSALMAGLKSNAGGRLEVCNRMDGNYPERWEEQVFPESIPEADAPPLT